MSFVATAGWHDGEFEVTSCSPPEDQLSDEVAEVFDTVRKMAQLLVQEKMPFTTADIRFGGHVADGDAPSNAYMNISGMRADSPEVKDESDSAPETPVDQTPA